MICVVLIGDLFGVGVLGLFGFVCYCLGCVVLGYWLLDYGFYVGIGVGCCLWVWLFGYLFTFLFGIAGSLNCLIFLGVLVCVCCGLFALFVI